MRYQQWQERITSKSLASCFGMHWSIPDYIMERRLQWLGQLRHMEDDRLPKRLLFGELVKKRLCHGTKKRWRDQMSGDLQAIGLKEGWYQLCQDRKQWSTSCHDGVEGVASCRKRNTCAANRQQQEEHCQYDCRRTIRQKGDLTRHKRFCNFAQSRHVSAQVDTKGTAIMVFLTVGRLQVFV